MRRPFGTILSGLAAAAVMLTVCVAPAPAPAQDLPSYARPEQRNAYETIHGRIVSVLGPFHITVEDDRGFVDDVVLRHGTVINPRGLRLAAGMTVTIVGFNAGASFEADEIDTPYDYSGDAPPAMYYGDGWYYPGYAYGYGPAWTLGLVGAGTILVPEPVNPPPSNPTPPPNMRSIEHPQPGHPTRVMLVGPNRAPATAPAYQPQPPPQMQQRTAPAYNAPAYRAPAPTYRAPEYRAPAAPAPVYREPPAPRGH
ncbi:MAG: hypothetical protein JO225_06500 [Candidatus Eremiobacteraeota bacterium]|nr:hypothetical protein [Candidatus Eremiobacteraeota bacterium]